MKRLILAAMLVAGPAMAQEPSAAGMLRALDNAVLFVSPQYVNECHDVRQWTAPGSCNVAIGLGAGLHLGESPNAAGNILIGDGAETPTPDAVGFVNIGNFFCGWRGDTPEQFRQVKCPEAN